MSWRHIIHPNPAQLDSLYPTSSPAPLTAPHSRDAPPPGRSITPRKRPVD